MEIHLSVDNISQEDAEAVVKTVSDILNGKDAKIRSIEVSETTTDILESTTLPAKTLQAERYFEHVVVRKVD